MRFYIVHIVCATVLGFSYLKLDQHKLWKSFIYNKRYSTSVTLSPGSVLTRFQTTRQWNISKNTCPWQLQHSETKLWEYYQDEPRLPLRGARREHRIQKDPGIEENPEHHFYLYGWFLFTRKFAQIFGVLFFPAWRWLPGPTTQSQRLNVYKRYHSRPQCYSS